jgi:hypothetical protein
MGLDDLKKLGGVDRARDRRHRPVFVNL